MPRRLYTESKSGRPVAAPGAAVLALALACSSPMTPSAVSRISVSPSSASLSIGQQVSLRGEAIGPDGRPVNERLYWSTEDPDVATVSPAGVVTAQATGRVRIAASLDGVSGSASVAVQPVKVGSLVVAPTSVTVGVGGTATLRAAAYDPGGHSVSALFFAWASSNQHVASVDTTGTVTGVAAGSATITVATDGQSATAAVTVTASSGPPPSGGGGGGGGGGGHGHKPPHHKHKR